jgi:hypothetical protein
MKRLLFLLMALSLAATASAGPGYGFMFGANWTEEFTGVDPGPGKSGNIFKIEDQPVTFYDFLDSTTFDLTAINQGPGPDTNPDPMIGNFITPYSGQMHFDSFFDVWFDVEIINDTTVDFGTGSGTFSFTGQGTVAGKPGYCVEFEGFGSFEQNFGQSGTMMGTGLVCVPAPGALLLGSLGVALVGAIRRRLA